MAKINEPQKPAKVGVTIALPAPLVDALDEVAAAAAPPTKRSPLYAWVLENWVRAEHPSTFKKHFRS